MGDIKTHEHGGATTRGGEYSEGARRVHWENTRAAYDKYYCDGCDQHQTYYRGDEDYGNYNSEGEYACASIENYYDGSCGYTSYDEEYRCWHQCETEHGGYYNDYDGEKTGGYETTYPPTDDDSGPTSREGGRGHRGEDGMCGIATHTPTMATILKRAIEREEM